MTMNELYKKALSFYGKPYIWGNNGPFAFDCSGLVQGILRSWSKDIIYPWDQTADELYLYFLGNGELNKRGTGALAFFGSTDKVTHVGWCMDDLIMINASGGSSEVTSLELAKVHNAYVKIEPIDMRKNLIAVIMPLYFGNGL